MVAIKHIFLFVVPALCGLIGRQASKITSDLNLIDSDVNALTAAVQKFNGTLSSAVPAQNAQTKLQNDIKSSTTDVNNSTAQTSADCTKFITYVNNVIAPDVKTGTDALVAKQAQFTSAGLKNTVCQGLKTNKSLADTFADALIKKCPAAQTSAGNAAKAKVDAALQAGINSYACT